MTTTIRRDLNILMLETKLRDLQRAVQVAERLAIDSDGGAEENELVVYAICNAAREAEVAVAVFYAKEAA